MASEDILNKLNRLTDREREVLQDFCRRMSYREIGERLFISPNTVKVHMHIITGKFELHDLEPSERKQKILEEFCPVLKSGLLEEPLPDEVERELPDLTPEQIREVEELEFPLVLYEPKTYVLPPTTETRSRRIRIAITVALGLILLGGLLTLGILYLLGVFDTGEQPLAAEAPTFTPQSTKVIEVTRIVSEVMTEEVTRIIEDTVIEKETVEVPIEVTVEVTSTPDPLQSTETLDLTATQIALDDLSTQVALDIYLALTAEAPLTTPTLTSTLIALSTNTPLTETLDSDEEPELFEVSIPDPIDPALDDDVHVYPIEFYLETVPTTGSFLVFDTRKLVYANTIWINNQLVGVNPGDPTIDENVWQRDMRVFVPASFLNEGINELRYESGHISTNFDKHYIDNFDLEVNYASVPSEADALEIEIDSTTSHIGDGVNNDWPVTQPDSASYDRLFVLPQQPTIGAILIVDTYQVKCPNPIWINGNFIGNLPGYNEKKWAGDVQIYVAPDYLLTGPNALHIDSTSCYLSTGLDDFMIRNTRILVNQ